MRSVQVREAKARFSALVEAAERGEVITITRHGRPAAVLISAEDARRLYPEGRPSIADLLLAMPDGLPEDLDLERDATPPRAIEF